VSGLASSKKLRKFSLQVLVFLKVHLYQKTYHEKNSQAKIKESHNIKKSRPDKKQKVFQSKKKIKKTESHKKNELHVLDQGPCIQQVDPQSRARLEDVSHHIDLL